MRGASYLSVTMLLALRLATLLWLSDGAAAFHHDLLAAFRVGRVGRLGQIQKLVPSLAPKADPVQTLQHGGAGLYLNMATVALQRHNIFLPDTMLSGVTITWFISQQR